LRKLFSTLQLNNFANVIFRTALEIHCSGSAVVKAGLVTTRLALSFAHAGKENEFLIGAVVTLILMLLRRASLRWRGIRPFETTRQHNKRPATDGRRYGPSELNTSGIRDSACSSFLTCFADSWSWTLGPCRAVDSWIVVPPA
jgi:hypothetical protein